MDMLKSRTSTAIEKTLGLKAIDKALRMDAEDVDHVRAHDNTTIIGKHAITAESVSRYVRGISESSIDELDALISDLGGLREKLLDDGNRIERDVRDFAAFNQAAVNLAEAVSEGVAQVKPTQPAD